MNQARMDNPAVMIPEAMKALYALKASAEKSAVTPRTLGLVELRASEINGCGVCVDMHARQLKKDGETDERLFAVAAWRDTPYFSEAERAALALTEALTRISDRPDPVSDEIWEEASASLRRTRAGVAHHRHREHQCVESAERCDEAGRGDVEGIATRCAIQRKGIAIA